MYEYFHARQIHCKGICNNVGIYEMVIVCMELFVVFWHFSRNSFCAKKVVLLQLSNGKVQSYAMHVSLYWLYLTVAICQLK